MKFTAHDIALLICAAAAFAVIFWS